MSKEETLDNIDQEIKQKQEQLYKLSHLIQEACHKERSFNEKTLEAERLHRSAVLRHEEQVLKASKASFEALEDANRKSGQAQNKLSEVLLKEQELKTKADELNSMKLFLTNQRANLESELKIFHEMNSRRQAQLDERAKSLEVEFDEKTKALSCENDKKTMISKEIDLKIEELKSLEKMKEQVNSKHDETSRKLDEIKAFELNVRKLKLETEEGIKQLNDGINKLKVKETEILTKNKDLNLKAQDIELRQRELTAKEFLVQKLIKVNNLEAQAK